MADAFAATKLAEVAVLSAYAETVIENARLHQQLLDSEQFFLSATDALPANLAILDVAGNIIRVNDDWQRFADANGFQDPTYGVGMNYPEVCDRASQRCAEAQQAAAGIRAIAEHKSSDFYLDYSCHSSIQRRWFQMRVRRFRDRNAERLIVVHQPVTEIRLAQEELTRALEEIAQLKERLQAENLFLHEELKDSYDFTEMVGNSPEQRGID